MFAIIFNRFLLVMLFAAACLSCLSRTPTNRGRTLAGSAAAEVRRSRVGPFLKESVKRKRFSSGFFP
jgi:hypothetical protein